MEAIDDPRATARAFVSDEQRASRWIFVLTLASCNQEPDAARCGIFNASTGVEDSVVESLKEQILGPLDQIRACEMGPYTFYLSGEGHHLLIRDAEQNRVWIEPNGDTSLFADGQPFLSVRDQDGDGNFDSLAYDVYGEEGQRFDLRQGS